MDMNYTKSNTGINKSVSYLIEDFGRLTKTDLKITLNNKEYNFTSPENIILSRGFFKTGLCQICARCCHVNTNLVYTSENNLKSLLIKKHFNLKMPIEINQNNKIIKRNLIIYPRKTECDYLDKENKCLINKDKPLQCRMHPIHFDIRLGKVYLTKREYKRNYKFGCKMKFDKFNYDTFKNDLIFLNDMKKGADDLGIDTYLPEIILYLESKKEEYMAGLYPAINIKIK